MMLVSDQYVPLNGAFELPLLEQLQSERRSFIKPLQYDSASVASFANFLLLDAASGQGGDYPLHVLSKFVDAKEQALKASAVEKCGPDAWVWHTDQTIPPLPASRRYPQANGATRVQSQAGTGADLREVSPAE
jgi:hypothetical protein